MLRSMLLFLVCRSPSFLCDDRLDLKPPTFLFLTVTRARPHSLKPNSRALFETFYLLSSCLIVTGFMVVHAKQRPKQVVS